MKWTPDLVLKLALLVMGLVTIVCLTVLISCGHDGILVDTFMGIAGVLFAGNAWQIGSNLLKK